MAVPSFRFTAACVVALFSTLLAASPAAAQVVISQAYGGGGNSGAPVRHDFIELFNAGSTAVSLEGSSVQYAAVGGTSWQATALTNVTLQPGQYYLVRQAAGTGTTMPDVTNHDASGSISMGGTSGKVAFVSGSTTALTGACPAAADILAYGSAAVCEPFTTAPSNSTAVVRKTAGCTNTTTNANDFEILAPNPRGTSTALNVCGGGGGTSTAPAMTLAASPATVEPGEPVLFTATIVPGTNPASTFITVLADLSALGGDALQALNDAGTDGDAFAGDNIYSYELTVGAVAGGTYPIPVGVADAQDRRDSDTVNVSVATLVAIHAIQGAGNTSPYAGQTVMTEGIVTARRSTGFYLQADVDDYDTSAATSEGVYVYTGSAPTANATVGNRVRVQAVVTEYTPATAPHQLSLTELTAPTYSVVSTGHALPPAVEIDATTLRADTLDSLERLEGMRVSVAELVVVAPSSGYIDENDAGSSTNGIFYGVLPGVARPMREEGVSVLDVTPFPGGITPPEFDANPELLRVQSAALSGTTALAVNVHDRVLGLTGILDYGFGAYTLAPDTVTDPATVTPVGTPVAVSDKASNEITVAGFNLLRFYDDVNDPESDVVLTAAAVAKRLAKTANAICKYVKAPDILGVVEVENLAVLQDLAATINAGDTQEAGACASNPQYVAYLAEGNDVGGIDVGFLVSTAEVAAGVERVEVLGVEQLNKDELLVNPDNSTTLLNDRPSLLLRARVHQGNGASRDLTVIVNHLRSLSDVNSTEAGANGWATAGARVRAKRAAQALSLANEVQAIQAANPDELVVLLGDFNAFEFSDGYVDSMGIISGGAAASGTVMNHVASPVTSPLTNLSALMAEGDRYSFSFDGSAQSLDHLLVNQAILDAGLGIRGEHARINADFGTVDYGDFTKATRVSDHDPVVLYLQDPAFSTADLAASVESSAATVAPGDTATFGVGVANGGGDAATSVSVLITVDVASASLAVTAPSGWACAAVTAAVPAQEQVRCTTATLAALASASFPVSIVAPAPGGRSVTVTAMVDSAMTDPAGSNNTASDSVAVAAVVDLAVAVTPASASVSAGTAAAWGVGIGNGSALAADAPTLVLELSEAVASAVVTPASGWSCDAPVIAGGKTTIACGAASMASGTAAFTVSAPTLSTSAGRTITLVATVDSGTTDPDAGNDAASADVVVKGLADLAVRVLAPTGPQSTKKLTKFTIGIANIGPQAATDVGLGVVVNAPAAAIGAFSAPGWTCGLASSDATSSTWACSRASFASTSMYNSIGVTVDGSQVVGNRMTMAASITASGTADPRTGNNSSAGYAKLVAK